MAMQWQVHPEAFKRHVAALEAAVREGADIPPLIVQFSEGHFTLNDGNHRFEAFRRAGVETYAVILWGTGQADEEELRRKYGRYL